MNHQTQIARVALGAVALIAASCTTPVELPPGVEPESAEGIYLSQCARCHAPDQIGRDPKRPFDSPGLSDTAHLTRLGRPYLEQIIRDGGSAVGRKKTMPGVDSTVTEEQLQSLINYLLSGGG